MAELVPSYALMMSTTEASSLYMHGWRDRIAVWEGALDEDTARVSDAPFAGSARYGGNITIPEADVFEFECTYSGTLGAPERRALESVVGQEIAGLIDADLATLGTLPVSANRNFDPSPELLSRGAAQIDLLLCTLPSRRGDLDGTLWHCARWARIIVIGQSLLIFYADPEGNWPPPADRWHHSGLPSRSRQWLDARATGSPIDIEEALLSYVQDFVHHQLYFLRSWPVELELWERKAFESLGRADSSINVNKLAALEVQLGHLGDYLNNARTSLRNFERKSETSRLVDAWPRVHSAIREHVREAESALQAARNQLRRAVALLSDVASLSALKTSELQRINSEKSQTFITLLTVFFIVPSAVIGIYGANIAELSPGMSGDLAGLAIWLGGSISMTIGVVRIITAVSNHEEPLPRWHWWVGGATALATLCCSLWTGSAMNITATSVSLLVTVLLFATAALQARRNITN